ncbi:MAG TPA: acyl-CoA dehydrogenase family protein, partial [Mycobacteriales bacterium]|nr:acyl-CoA dehydrogenase family protein [Mycobacteriales bacterium]
MGHYKSNVRDLEFNLFELLGAGDRLGSGRFADLDADVAREMLSEVSRLATGPLAESFADADRHPPVFDPATHSVTLPESFKRAYTTYVEADWPKLGAPEELGGLGVPRTLAWAIAELVLGSNPAAFMYGAGPSFAGTIHQLGTPAQQRIAQHLVDRHWGATMVLTEPDAGSDVGAGRTRAIAQADGTWHIEGVKRFITSGEW